MGSVQALPLPFERSGDRIAARHGDPARESVLDVLAHALILSQLGGLRATSKQLGFPVRNAGAIVELAAPGRGVCAVTPARSSTDSSRWHSRSRALHGRWRGRIAISSRSIRERYVFVGAGHEYGIIPQRAGTTSGPQVVPCRQSQLPREAACLWRSGPKSAVPSTEDGPALRVISSEPCPSPPAPDPMVCPQDPPDLECCFRRLSPINSHRGRSPGGPTTRVWSRQWDRSAIATTTPSSNLSGAEWKPNS